MEKMNKITIAVRIKPETKVKLDMLRNKYGKSYGVLMDDAIEYAITRVEAEEAWKMALEIMPEDLKKSANRNDFINDYIYYKKNPPIQVQ